MLTVLIVGILFTVGGLYLTYKYLIIDGIGVIYKHTTPFFKKLAVLLVDKAETAVTQNGEIKNKNLQKTVDTGKMLNEVYGRKVPKFVQKGINLIIGIIPFSDLLLSVKDDLKNSDKEKTSLILYNGIDNYIKNSILGGNSMKPVYFLLIFNIILQVGLMLSILHWAK